MILFCGCHVIWDVLLHMFGENLLLSFQGGADVFVVGVAYGAV